MQNILEIFSFFGMQYTDKVEIDIFDHFKIEWLSPKSALLNGCFYKSLSMVVT